MATAESQSKNTQFDDAVQGYMKGTAESIPTDLNGLGQRYQDIASQLDAKYVLIKGVEQRIADANERIHAAKKQVANIEKKIDRNGEKIARWHFVNAFGENGGLNWMQNVADQRQTEFRDALTRTIVSPLEQQEIKERLLADLDAIKNKRDNISNERRAEIKADLALLELREKLRESDTRLPHDWISLVQLEEQTRFYKETLPKIAADVAKTEDRTAVQKLPGSYSRSMKRLRAQREDLDAMLYEKKDSLDREKDVLGELKEIHANYKAERSALEVALANIAALINGGGSNGSALYTDEAAAGLGYFTASRGGRVEEQRKKYTNEQASNLNALFQREGQTVKYTNEQAANLNSMFLREGQDPVVLSATRAAVAPVQQSRAPNRLREYEGNAGLLDAWPRWIELHKETGAKLYASAQGRAAEISGKSIGFAAGTNEQDTVLLHWCMMEQIRLAYYPYHPNITSFDPGRSAERDRFASQDVLVREHVKYALEHGVLSYHAPQEHFDNFRKYANRESVDPYVIVLETRYAIHKAWKEEFGSRYEQVPIPLALPVVPAPESADRKRSIEEELLRPAVSPGITTPGSSSVQAEA